MLYSMQVQTTIQAWNILTEWMDARVRDCNFTFYILHVIYCKLL